MSSRKYLDYKFNKLRVHCTALTDAEFAAVTNDLIETTIDYIDQDDLTCCGRYFYESAVNGVARRLNIQDEEKLSDIDLLAFEYSMFMGD